METTSRRGGPQAPEHYHPHQEEHLVVLEGTVGVMVDGTLQRLEATSSPCPPGPGTASSGGRPVVSARWEVRPVLRSAEFLATTFGLAQDGQVTDAGVPRALRSVQIAREFDPEFRMRHPPRIVQRVTFPVLGALAQARGVTRPIRAAALTRPEALS